MVLEEYYHILHSWMRFFLLFWLIWFLQGSARWVSEQLSIHLHILTWQLLPLLSKYPVLSFIFPSPLLQTPACILPLFSSGIPTCLSTRKNKRNCEEPVAPRWLLVCFTMIWFYYFPEWGEGSSAPHPCCSRLHWCQSQSSDNWATPQHRGSSEWI